MKRLYTILLAVVALVAATLLTPATLWAQEDQTTYEEWYAKAVNGDANAQFQLGVAYRLGAYGVEIDYEKAVEWYRMSAKNGDVNGMFY